MIYTPPHTHTLNTTYYLLIDSSTHRLITSTSSPHHLILPAPTVTYSTRRSIIHRLSNRPGNQDNPTHAQPRARWGRRPPRLGTAHSAAQHSLAHKAKSRLSALASFFLYSRPTPQAPPHPRECAIVHRHVEVCPAHSYSCPRHVVLLGLASFFSFSFRSLPFRLAVGSFAL
jgi:hypothetical protein